MDKQPIGTNRPLGTGLLLYVVATLLMAVFYTIGIIYGIFVSLYKRQFVSGLRAIDNKLFTMAIMKDETGNIVCKELFDKLLIESRSENKFGAEDETISSVLGKNELGGTLTPTGDWLAETLNSIQPNHCINSIEN